MELREYYFDGVTRNVVALRTFKNTFKPAFLGYETKYNVNTGENAKVAKFSDTHYVDKNGTVYSIKKEKVSVLSTNSFTKGFRMIHYNGIFTTLNKMVWEAFTGHEVPDGYVVKNKNGDKTDSRYENLMIVTRSELAKPKEYEVPKECEFDLDKLQRQFHDAGINDFGVQIFYNGKPMTLKEVLHHD